MFFPSMALGGSRGAGVRNTGIVQNLVLVIEEDWRRKYE